MSATVKLRLLKYVVWAVSAGLPLLANYLEGSKALGPVAVLAALAARKFDKDVIEPYEAELNVMDPDVEDDPVDANGDKV